MNIFKRTYVKMIDKVTIEKAPKSKDGIVGFNNNSDLCIENGYKELRFSSGSTGWKIYTDMGDYIQEGLYEYDSLSYESQVSGLINSEYTYDQQLAIQRKKLAGIDEAIFNQFNVFCEICKKSIKLKIIGN